MGTGVELCATCCRGAGNCDAVGRLPRSLWPALVPASRPPALALLRAWSAGSLHRGMHPLSPMFRFVRLAWRHPVSLPPRSSLWRQGRDRRRGGCCLPPPLGIFPLADLMACTVAHPPAVHASAPPAGTSALDHRGAVAAAGGVAAAPPQRVPWGPFFACRWASTRRRSFPDAGPRSLRRRRAVAALYARVAALCPPRAHQHVRWTRTVAVVAARVWWLPPPPSQSTLPLGGWLVPAAHVWPGCTSGGLYASRRPALAVSMRAVPASCGGVGGGGGGDVSWLAPPGGVDRASTGAVGPASLGTRVSSAGGTAARRCRAGQPGVPRRAWDAAAAVARWLRRRGGAGPPRRRVVCRGRRGLLPPTRDVPVVWAWGGGGVWAPPREVHLASSLFFVVFSHCFFFCCQSFLLLSPRPHRARRAAPPSRLHDAHDVPLSPLPPPPPPLPRLPRPPPAARAR